MFLWKKMEPDLDRTEVLACGFAVTHAVPLRLRGQRGDVL
jgi:hypothetical protein